MHNKKKYCKVEYTTKIFEGDSADMCFEKNLLLLMGAKQMVKRAQTREWGPPSAQLD